MFFNRREREPEPFEPFQYKYAGPCGYCGEHILVEMPWFRDKTVAVKCKACGIKQELYPNRTLYIDKVKDGRETK